MIINIIDIQNQTHILDTNNIGNNAFNIDCMDVLKKLPDNCFDLAVVDPPYGIEKAFSATSRIQKYGQMKTVNDKKPTIDYFKQLCQENFGHDYEADKCSNCYTSSFISYILPTDVAPVRHGKWTEVQKENIWGDIIPVFECSLCGKYTFGTKGITEKSNYCPNCGARMDEEE